MNGSGTCTCQTGWAKSTRGLCEVCDSGYYGENCNLCPNCGAHGTCDEGVVGDKGYYFLFLSLSLPFSSSSFYFYFIFILFK